MSDELLPCPFCAGEAKITKHFKYDDLFNLIHRCRLVGPIMIDWRDREQIVANWNTRSGIPRA